MRVQELNAGLEAMGIEKVQIETFDNGYSQLALYKDGERHIILEGSEQYIYDYLIKNELIEVA